MSLTKTCVFIFSLALLPALAFAGPLATDPNSYSDIHGIWHGSSSFQAFDAFNQPTGLSGFIDWSVYGPNSVLPAGLTGYTPTPGEAVYVYQAYETGSAPLSSVSVEIDNPADNIGSFTATGINGDSPISSFLLSFDSANWLFNGVAQGGSTMALVFSSPNVPMMSVATTIDDGSVAINIPVPSPNSMHIPEPSSLVLAACGFALLVARRLRQRRKT